MSRSRRRQPDRLPGFPLPLDRRDFILTAGGILVSAAAVSGCPGDPMVPPPPPPPGKATVRVQVDGLINGSTPSPTGGSGTGAEVGGSRTLTLPVPNPNAQGVAVGDLPGVDPGVFDITYVPPANFRLLATDPATKRITLVADQTETVLFHCEPIPIGGPGIAGQVLVQGTSIGLAGGTVQVLNGSTVVASLAVGAGGQYSGNVVAGSYTAKYHPPGTHSLGDAEPDTKPATIGSSTITVNFTAKPSFFYDTFQAYTSDANLRSGGLVVPGVTDQNGGWSNPNSIFLDQTGGPTGGKAMRYDWPARPASGCNADITIRAQMRLNPARSGANWYFRWREKMTNPWQNGSQASCPSGQWEYKFFNAHFAGGALYAILMPHGHGTGNPNPNLAFNLTMSSGSQSTSNALQGNELNLGNPAVWPGVYRLFVLEVRGHGTATPTVALYIDGVQVKTLAHPGTNYTFASNNSGFVELGANLDSGPDTVQSRWFSELGIYDTRPALI